MDEETKGGARHSKKDTEAINTMLNLVMELGGVCPHCGNAPIKATFRDMEDRIFAAWVAMAKATGAEMEYHAWPHDYYENNLIVRRETGRYISYPFVDAEGRILFGVPTIVERVYIPAAAMPEVADIPGVVKTAEEIAGLDATDDTPPTEATSDEPTAAATETETAGAAPESDAKSLGYPFFDNSLKIIREDEKSVVVGNYIMLFDKPDLEGHGSERVNGDGSTGEFFTPETDWSSPYTEAGAIHVDWEHGAGAEAPELAGEHGILGYADMKSAKVDERGVFVERVLSRRQKYVDWLADLIRAGKVGTSSQAIRGRTKKALNGAIEAWPLYRDSLTVNPMQWENVGDLPTDLLSSLKALADNCPEFANELKAAGLFAGASEQADATDKGSGGELVLEALKIEGDLINLGLAE